MPGTALFFDYPSPLCQQTADAMHTTFQFHDSEIRLARAGDDKLTLEFSAAHVTRSTGAQDSEPQPGYVRSLEFSFVQASWSGVLQECLGRLSQGRLWLEGRACSTLPLPFEASCPVRCELAFHNGAVLCVSATALVCRFSGEPHFVESYAC